MTHDEIIEMAEKAKLDKELADDYCRVEYWTATEDELIAFAKLIEQSVAAKEREACAEVCKEVYRVWTCESDEEMDYPDPHDCMRAIRARGQA